MNAPEDNSLKVAIVGAGPAGFYAAAQLLAAGDDVVVNMFERLPVPFGLVRFGVAPDHPKIKSVTRVYEKTAANERFHFFGNVDVGTDITHEELLARHHAVIYSTGAAHRQAARDPRRGPRRARIRRPSSSPGTTATQTPRTSATTSRRPARSSSATATSRSTSRGCSASRARSSSTTDTADHAIDVLADSEIEEIVMLGRRGLAQAAFTNPELRELGEMADADVVVDPARRGARPAQRRVARARGRRRARAPQRRHRDRVLDAHAAGQAPADRAALPRLAGRDPRQRPRRGDPARAQRARAERGRLAVGAPDGRDGDPRLRARLPLDRLPRQRAAGAAFRRAARDDPQRGRARGRRRRRAVVPASTPRAGSSAGRPASSARTRRTRTRRSTRCSRTAPRAGCPHRRSTTTSRRSSPSVPRPRRLHGLEAHRRPRAGARRAARPAAGQAHRRRRRCSTSRTAASRGLDSMSTARVSRRAGRVPPPGIEPGTFGLRVRCSAS